MFDLEKTIATWRNSLPTDLANRPERVDELEQHLRDAFDQQTATGATPQTAWSSALQSLGATRDIAGEFVKLDGRVWIPAWLATGGMALIILALITGLGFKLRGQPLLAAHVLIITTGYCAVFAVGFLAMAAILSRAIFGWSDHQQQSFQTAGKRLILLAFAATIPGIVLGAIWAHDHMGRWWAWDPREIGGLCVLAWSLILLKSFASRSTPPQFLMMLGVIGNAVVAISWFGPVLVMSSHSYGIGPSFVGAILSCFLILQMGLVYLALLPARALRVHRFGSRA